MAEARVEVTVGGTDTAVAELRKLTNEERQLTKAFDQGKISSEQFSAWMNELSRQKQTLQRRARQAATGVAQLSKAQQEAATKAVLIGQQLGVTLPTAMQRLVVRSNIMGRAINAAFAAGAVLFFIDQLDNVKTKIIDIGTKIDLLGAKALAHLPLVGGFFKDIAQAADDAKRAAEDAAKAQEMMGQVFQLSNHLIIPLTKVAMGVVNDPQAARQAATKTQAAGRKAAHDNSRWIPLYRGSDSSRRHLHHNLRW